MWLIDTSTLKLKEFHHCPTEQYAILSHTWRAPDEEPTFKDLQADEAQAKPGFEKITMCCSQAKRDGLSWAWVDTCCINKESSTELSEAINSMFKWYQLSKVCYIYLDDVSSTDVPDPWMINGLPRTFAQSRWFTRGWTLQELIAPQACMFFTREWGYLGAKSGLARSLKQITGINGRVLQRRLGCLNCSIAQRMSWASRRQTTRPEDMSYCLLGIFNVDLPLLYGEGTTAFLRLQQRIIEESDDETIFAWTEVPDEGSGLLASSPASFAHCAGIKQLGGYFPRASPYFSNKGLSIECEMLPCQMNTCVVPLNCASTMYTYSKNYVVVIFVARTLKRNQFRRVSYRGASTGFAEEWELHKAKVRTIFVSTPLSHMTVPRYSPFWPERGVPTISLMPPYFAVWQCYPEERAQPPYSSWTQRFLIERELVEVRPPATRLVLRDLTPIKFDQHDLQWGAEIAIVRNAHCICELQFGFTSEFHAVCNARMGQYKLEVKQGDEVIHRAPLRQLLRMPEFGSLWNSEARCNTEFLSLMSKVRKLVSPDPKCSERTYKVHRTCGAYVEDSCYLHKIRNPYLFSDCTELSIYFKSNGGTEWSLEIDHSREHTHGWIGNMCTICILSNAMLWVYLGIIMIFVIGLLVMFCCALSMLISLTLGIGDASDPFTPLTGFTCLMLSCALWPYLFFSAYEKKKIPLLNRLLED